VCRRTFPPKKGEKKGFPQKRTQKVDGREMELRTQNLRGENLWGPPPRILNPKKGKRRGKKKNVPLFKGSKPIPV